MVLVHWSEGKAEGDAGGRGSASGVSRAVSLQLILFVTQNLLEASFKLVTEWQEFGLVCFHSRVFHPGTRGWC